MRTVWAPLVVVVANALTWALSLQYRWPYLNQIPVHDLDVTTSVAVMWARSWWWEGAFKLGFALPYAPLSIETPTLAARRVYESWPPGLVFPVYFSALALGQEPSVALVNWINVIGHGLTALFVSITAYLLCRFCGWRKFASVLVSCAVPFVALLQRGPLYFFSQIYTMDPHVLVYVSAFVCLECLYHYNESPRVRRAISVALLVLAILGCLVDWLMYFVIAVWFAGRLLGQRFNLGPAMTIREWVAALATPFVGFALFLTWRFSLEGSLARTQGLRAAFADIVWKVAYRAGMEPGYPLPKPFGAHLWWMHEYYFSSIAPWLLTAAGWLIVVLSLAQWHRSRSVPLARRRLFITVFVTALLTIPTYAQMLVFRQHTEIHAFAIAKVIMPYAFVPFVTLPLMIFGVVFPDGSRGRWLKAISGMLILAGAIEVGLKHERPYLIGRIDPERMKLWETIRRHVSYRDVVFSPELEAPAFKVEMGISNKLVHRARNFRQIGRVVGEVCGPLDVVVVLPGEAAETTWSVPDQVIRDNGLTFLRFVDFPGTRTGCR